MRKLLVHFTRVPGWMYGSYKEFQQGKFSSKNLTLYASAISRHFLYYVKLYSTAFHQPSLHCFIQEDKALPDQSRKGKKLNQEYPWYTHLQKKLKFSKVAFLLGKIVGQWTLSPTSFLQDQWPRGTRKNGQIKLMFPLEKSVFQIFLLECWCQGSNRPLGVTTGVESKIANEVPSGPDVWTFYIRSPGRPHHNFLTMQFASHSHT